MKFKKLTEEVRWLWSGEKLKQTIVLFVTILICTSASANPVVDHVSSGNVSIQQTPNSTVINQTSQKAIINWKSFNIGQSEATHFQQPAGGVALNRISPTQGASSIYGRLTATGQIILVNPAGIFFGPGAYVNVGGLIASTKDISDKNFLDGNYHFDGVSPYSGSIINQGQIIAADHGLVALIGDGVQNNGLIQANVGHVVLASGDAFTMSFAGNDLVHFSIDVKSTKAGVDQNGNRLKDGVSNTGSIIANGGSILVSASAAQGVLDHMINLEGVAQARSVYQQNGEIILSGDADSGVVRVAAKLDASGKNKTEKGGNITITGHNILLDNNSSIDVSGDAGGGNIYIGGGVKGQGTLAHANATVMAPNTMILADAITQGDGGNVVLWSDYVTKAYGTISARGGALSGNGGFIETSSHNALDISGIRIDTRAANGLTGDWLLDPLNVNISTASTSNGGFSGGDPNIYSPTSTGANVNTTDLANNLNAANVTITTGLTGAEAGNITVSDPITWTSSNTLLLDAANNIIINAAITGLNGTLQLNAGSSTNTITTGASGGVSVANFNLLRGQWTQVSASLPTFSVTNNFQINSGTLPSANARFIRALSGDGTGGSPYVIADVYGLQGIASDTTTQAASYNLNNNINAAVTSNWNSGAGFIPVDTYSGTFDGQGFTISNLYINRSTSSDWTALFGKNNGTIQNVGLTNVSIAGGGEVGALAGDNFGTITNSYSTGNLSSIGSAGGLVGRNYNSITNSYSTVNVSATSGSVYGGLVGENTGTIDNSYSLGNVVVTNGLIVGGFVGQNVLGTGVITNSYSAGYVPTNNNSAVGGFAGYNNSGVINTSFWNTATSGQSSGIGVDAGTTNNLSGQTTSTLMTQATYTTAPYSWDFATVWNIVAGQSYPYLRAIYSATPRIISGTTGSATNANNVIELAANGAIIDTVRAGANGFFYFFESNGSIIDGTGLLTYIDGGASQANNVAVAPTSGGSLSNSTAIALTANTIQLGANSGTSTLSNGILNTAKGALSDTDILYSVSSGNLTLNSGVSLNTASSSVTYNVDGNIAATNGNINLSGPIVLTASGNLTTTTAGNITLGSINAFISTFGLTLNSAGTINLNGAIGGSLRPNFLSATSSSGINLNTTTINTANAQTYTGPVVLGANATLNSQSSNINFTSTINSDGTPRSLLLQYAGSTTFGGNIGGSAALTTLTVTNTSGLSNINFNGATQITTSGDQNYNDNVSLANDVGFTSTAGDVLFANAVAGSGGTRTLTITNADVDSIITGVLSSAALTKAGSGTLTLNAVNTYSGATNINAGTLSLNVTGTIANSAVTLANVSGANLNLNSNSKTIASLSGGGTTGGNVIIGNSSSLTSLTLGGDNSSTSFGGVISGAGGITKNGSGTFTLTNTNTYTGNTNINTGTLLLSSTGNLSNGTTVALADNATAIFDIGGNNKTIGLLSGGGTTGGNVSLGAGTLTLGANNLSATYAGVISGSGGISKEGGGTFTLTGANTYTGATSITGGGNFDVGASNAISDSSAIVNSGILRFANGVSDTVGSLAGAGIIFFLGSNALTLGGDNTSTTYSGNFFGSGSITKTGTGTQTLSGNNAGVYTGTVSINNGGLSVGNNAALGDSAFILNGGALSAASSGISVANNYTVNSASAIGGSNNFTLSGTGALNADLTVSNTATTTLSGILSGSANLIKSGSGTLILGAANTYNGATQINGGTLQLNATGTIANSAVVLANVSGAVLDINGNSKTIASLAGGGSTGGNVTLGSGTLTVGGNDADTTFGGVISGSGGLTKQGEGTMTMSGANAYTGATTLNKGGIRLGANDVIADNSAVVLANANNTTLFMNGFSDTIGSLAGGGTTGGVVFLNSGSALTVGNDNTSTVFDGQLTSNGSLTKIGSGSLTLTSSSNNYSGGTNLNAGTLIAGDNSALGSNTLTFNGGTLSSSTNGIALANNFVVSSASAIGGSNTITLSGTGTLNADLSVSNTANTTISGNMSGTGGITKTAASTLILSGLNSYSGNTVITTGTLQSNSGGALSDNSNISIAGGATLSLNNTSDTIADLSGSGDIAVSSGQTLSVSGGSYSGAITGAGNLEKVGSGTLILLGANGYTGTTTISGGTLQLGASGVIADTSAVILANTSGAVLDLNNFSETIGSLSGGGSSGGNVTTGNLSSLTTLTLGGDNSSTSFGGVISGTGGITKAGSGTFTLTGTNTYTGTTNINTGTVLLSSTGNLSNGTTVNLANNATAVFDIGGNNKTIGLLSGGGNLGGNVSLGAGTLTLGANGLTATYAGVISGSGGISKEGSSTFTLTGTNTYTGATSVTGAGLFSIGASNAIADSSAIINSGAMSFANGVSDTVGSLSGSGSIIFFGGNALTIGGDNTSTTYSGGLVGSASLTKIGTGTQILSGNNGVYLGTVSINSGTLSTNSSNAMGVGTLILNGGTLSAASNGISIANNYTVNSTSAIGGSNNFTLSGAGTLNADLTVSNTATTTLSGVIGGNSGLIKSGSGTLTLSNANNYNGTTTINGGNVIVSNNTALGSTVGGTIINSGAALNINNAAIGNETVTINNATLSSTGTASLAGAVILSASTSNTIDINSSSALTLTGNINGNADLAISGDGTFNLGGNIGNGTALSSLNISTDVFNILNNGNTGITTSGNQTYTTQVALNTDQTFTGTGIAFSNGISGNKNVAINGSTISLVNSLDVNNLTVTGTGGSNTLGVNSGSYENWNITGTNVGNLGVTGVSSFTFNNIQNLTGGDNGNKFTFSDNAILNGSINGGSLANSNTLDFTAYNSPMTVTLSGNINDGNVVNNNSSTTITNFTNINDFSQNSAYANTLVLPNKQNTVYVTGVQNGYVGDPTYFNGFTIFSSLSSADIADFLTNAIQTGSNTVTVNGVTLYFYNFGSFTGLITSSSTDASTTTYPIDVSAIIQQPTTNADSDDSEKTTSAWTIVGETLDQNLNDITKQAADMYNVDMNKIKINPYCYAAS